MTPRCTEIDLFFDGELESDQAAAFRDHLATCERCQRVLLGRMQEAVAADTAAEDAANALDDAIAGAHVDDSVAAADPAVPDADLLASARASLAAESAPAPEDPVPIAEAPVPVSNARHTACRRRRVLLYAAPAVAAAAALPFIWFARSHDGPLDLAYQIEHGPTRARGVARVGDVLHPTASGERHRVIAVYFEKRDLRAACPGNPRCTDVDSKLELRVTLNEPGLYTIVALGSDEEIAPPASGTPFDEYLAQCTRIHCKQDTVEVDD